MTQPSLESFFTAGGGKSVTWKDRPIGSTVSGIIEAVHPPQQVTDPVDGKPKFKRDGTTPLMQVRVDLQTPFRGYEMCRPPEDASEPDDGRRSLYVGGWMKGAIGDALQKAGRQGPPEVGAELSVTLSERTPPDNPALNPTNKFTATYKSPTTAATAEFFGGGNGTATAPMPGSPAYQGAPAATAVVDPERPPSIPEAAWATMDAATRENVAKTFADIPPF